MLQIETEVEVYPEPDFTKEIVGGSLGGLAFLALLTAVLYKVRHSCFSVNDTDFQRERN